MGVVITLGMAAAVDAATGLPLSLLTFFILTYCLAPDLVLRLAVLAYPKGDDRREELVNELRSGAVPRVERPQWVACQLLGILVDGFQLRRTSQRKRRRASRTITMDSIIKVEYTAGDPKPTEMRVTYRTADGRVRKQYFNPRTAEGKPFVEFRHRHPDINS